LLETVRLFGETSKANMRRISLSSDTAQRRISDMPEDVKDQIITEMKTSPMLFMDESTWVASYAQLLVFMTRIHSGDIKFLFCEELQNTTSRCSGISKNLLILHSCSGTTV